MSLDQHLIETIKTHFSRKSSAQLEEIVRKNDLERWSQEAIVAATELLDDRRDGREAEPPIPEEEEQPPEYHYEPEHIALGVLGGLLTGYLVIPYYRRIDENPDLPVPFGPRLAWLALDTTDTEAVAKSLLLRKAVESTWAEGVEAAYQSRVFVTPPLGDWTLVASTSLFPRDRVDPFVKPMLQQLSRQFSDAQYYCTQGDLQLHGWARAKKGKLIRGYAWLGKDNATLWDEGAPTREEMALGLRFVEGKAAALDPTGTEATIVPDEACVTQLASLWSIDPSTLDELFKEPVPGLVGTAIWAANRSGG